VSGGGLFVNLIPKEGGNVLSGSSFLSYTNSSWQGDNVTQELKDKGLRTGDTVAYIYDTNFSLGGPIVQDKLWFFGSFRDVGNANRIANSFYSSTGKPVSTATLPTSGKPGEYDQHVQNYTARLTYQASERNKITAYIDRVFKHVGHEYASGTEVEFASRVWPTPLYYTGAVKWTSTLTDKFLVEAGVGSSYNDISMTYQPGVHKERGTPEWYANASRLDLVTGYRTVAGSQEQWSYPPVYMITGQVSHVTGSNTLKVGGIRRWGSYRINTNINADLVQRYRSGVPDSVIVYNTPQRTRERINQDLGLFVQDSLIYHRLTVNPGLRFEHFNAQIEAMQIEPGRFVGFRTYDGIKDLPNWNGFAPRLGVVYDVTGDQKTALRFGLNKYHVSYSNNATNPYDPMNLRSDIRNWNDCDYIPGTSTCSALVLPTNRDNIAQDNEIGPVVSPFGNNRFADPNRKRDYNIQYNAGIDRQLTPRVGVNFAWFKRSWYNLPITINQLVDPDKDWTPFQTTNPLTGQEMTLYNLNPAKAGQSLLYDTNSTDRSKTRRDYVGYEVGATVRLPNGGTLIGGWAVDRTINVTCENPDPNLRYNCDQSQFDVPLRGDFKFIGTYPVKYGVIFGAVLQSYAGKAVPVSWSVPANVFPGGRRTAAVTLQTTVVGTGYTGSSLSEPGTSYLDRWNQLDMSFRRAFKLGRIYVDGSFDVFNVLNDNVTIAENQAFGAALHQPTEILQPRLFRISSTMKF
jgi:hypothetical protein